LLDTMLAATCKTSGVSKIITNNEEDFRVFGFLEVVKYRGA
jgi:predicted nucleic acid-binding protein